MCPETAPYSVPCTPLSFAGSNAHALDLLPQNTDRLLAQHGWNMIVAGFWAVASCYCIAMKWRAAAVIVLVQYFFSW